MMHLLFAILFILAGCGNDVASSHDVAPFSAGSESSALEESSSSAHNVVSELSSDDAHISSAESPWLASFAADTATSPSPVERFLESTTRTFGNSSAAMQAEGDS